VHVYDLHRDVNDVGWVFGIGIFHTGIEIYGKEYAFGYHDDESASGVFAIAPRSAPAPATYRETIELGATPLSEGECERAIARLSREFTGPSYDLLTRNCNSFTEAMAEAVMGETGKVPAYVNRLARIGRFAHAYAPCLVPASIRRAITTVPGRNRALGDGSHESEDEGEDERLTLTAPGESRMSG